MRAKRVNAFGDTRANAVPETRTSAVLDTRISEVDGAGLRRTGLSWTGPSRKKDLPKWDLA